MATRKTAKTAHKKKRKSSKSRSAAKKTAGKTRAKKRSTGKAKAGGSAGVRVRMYRVGFGDFFLLTVPGAEGPAHILIDCGVHAANIHSMDECVEDLKETTGSNLALIILTHYHADHMSGFASNYDDFMEFEVGAVWITNRLDPEDEAHSKFMAQLTSLAGELNLHLGAREDHAGRQAARQVENAIGSQLGATGKKQGGNAKALELLTSGFKGGKTPAYYYQGGDEPKLPAELEGKITAEILAPAPLDEASDFRASDNKKEQYLAAVADKGVPDPSVIEPFEKDWPATVKDYPPQAFDEFDTGLGKKRGKRAKDGAKRLERALQDMQPDALAAIAKNLDGTLNNQSLVVLFTVAEKKLLFVGDAQWGNWSYWLYGKSVTGSDTDITDSAKDILGSIDFYKVGHHGSTNATPIPVVHAMSQACASMCSTATGAYGHEDKNTEVPRIPLMKALEDRTKNRLVRSDWVEAAEAPADETKPGRLPTGFSSPGNLYIDFEL